MRTFPILLSSAVALCSAPHLPAQSIAQEAYIKQAVVDGESFSDRFGWSVAISGNTAVVGAPSERSAATGVNGDQTNNDAVQAGAAYVLSRDASGWTQQAYLKASDSFAGDEFGFSVAIDGDTIIVGAPNEDSDATGVNGDQINQNAPDAGAVYVFVRDGDSWTQQAYLKASNTDAEDNFGMAVAIEGDRLVVGARRESSAATGVDGDQTDNSAWQAGAVYVFERDDAVWSQQAYLKATNTGSRDTFGEKVAVSGDTIAVSALGEASDDTGINGDQGGGAPFAGAVYVFKKGGSGWLQQAYVKASNTNDVDGFGTGLALFDDMLVVGAPGEDSPATGINGEQLDDSAPSSGAVYVFERTGPIWSQSAYIKASNTGTGDLFGETVALSDDFLVVGAARESSASDGVDSDQNDDSAYFAGAAYAFARDGSTFEQVAYIKASNSDEGDGFAMLGLSGATLVIGAPYEDSDDSGIGATQDNFTGSFNAGAAYAFDLSGIAPGAWSDEGGALFGAAGDPLLVGSGSLYAGSSNAVALSNAAPSALLGLFIGLSNSPTPFKGGMLKPVPWLKLAFANTTPSGALSLPFEQPFGVPSGFEIWVQAAITDAGAPVGVALSNALRGVVP